MKANLSLALVSLFTLALSSVARAVTTENDGDWTLQNVILDHTPEADRMVRIGDIDNLGFGWPTGFNPFSGQRTPAHAYPWTANNTDYSGTDRIMVITSFDHSISGDGYSGGTSRPANSVRPLVLTYPVKDLTVTSATLQIFADDFQAPYFGSNYQVTLNGKRVPSFESVVNNLVQTGPVGNIITLPVPAELLDDVRSGTISLVFDDFTTHAGDGYAIDFVKLLINPAGSSSFAGTLTGHVTSSAGGPLAGITVTAGNLTAQTDANGLYTLTNIPAGVLIETASSAAYAPQSRQASITTGNSSTLDFVLRTAGTALAPATGIAGLEWRTGGNANWTGQIETTGNAPVAMSGQINDNESTWMEATFPGPGVLTFALKSSSEGPDHLTVTVRGVANGFISGNSPWATRTINLAPGQNIVRWTYRKDGSAASGLDAAWVGQVSYAPYDFPQAVAAANLSGNSATPAAIPFSDGLTNLLKFAFNLDLSRTDYEHLDAGAGDAVGVPSVTSTQSGDSLTLRIEFLRRKGVNLTYAPMISSGLEAATVWTAITDTPVVTDIDPYFERAVYSHVISVSAAQNSYVRVAVSRPD